MQPSSPSRRLLCETRFLEAGETSILWSWRGSRGPDALPPSRPAPPDASGGRRGGAHCLLLPFDPGIGTQAVLPTELAFRGPSGVGRRASTDAVGSIGTDETLRRLAIKAGPGDDDGLSQLQLGRRCMDGPDSATGATMEVGSAETSRGRDARTGLPAGILALRANRVPGDLITPKNWRIRASAEQETRGC